MVVAREIPTGAATKGEVDGFVEEFIRFGCAPTPQKYWDLFHPEATLIDSGLKTPISGEGLLTAGKRIVDIFPDFRIDVKRYRSRGNAVYMEAWNSGTTKDGTRIEYGATYVSRLKNGKVIDARRYYDQAKLLKPYLEGLPSFPEYTPTHDDVVAGKPAAGTAAAVDPEDFVSNYATTWANATPELPYKFASCYNADGQMINPGMDTPITKAQIPGYYKLLLTAAPDFFMNLVGWAGDANCIFVEWLGGGTWFGHPLSVRVVDVFDFEGRGVKFGQAYFDSLSAVELTEPRVFEIRRLLFNQ